MFELVIVASCEFKKKRKNYQAKKKCKIIFNCVKNLYCILQKNLKQINKIQVDLA